MGNAGTLTGSGSILVPTTVDSQPFVAVSLPAGPSDAAAAAQDPEAPAEDGLPSIAALPPAGGRRRSARIPDPATCWPPGMAPSADASAAAQQLPANTAAVPQTPPADASEAAGSTGRSTPGTSTRSGGKRELAALDLLVVSERRVRRPPSLVMREPVEGQLSDADQPGGSSAAPAGGDKTQEPMTAERRPQIPDPATRTMRPPSIGRRTSGQTSSSTRTLTIAVSGAASGRGAATESCNETETPGRGRMATPPAPAEDARVAAAAAEEAVDMRAEDVDDSPAQAQAIDQHKPPPAAAGAPEPDAGASSALEHPVPQPQPDASSLAAANAAQPSPLPDAADTWPAGGSNDSASPPAAAVPQRTLFHTPPAALGDSWMASALPGPSSGDREDSPTVDVGIGAVCMV